MHGEGRSDKRRCDCSGDCHQGNYEKNPYPVSAEHSILLLALPQPREPRGLAGHRIDDFDSLDHPLPTIGSGARHTRAVPSSQQEKGPRASTREVLLVPELDVGLSSPLYCHSDRCQGLTATHPSHASPPSSSGTSCVSGLGGWCEGSVRRRRQRLMG